MNACLYSPDVSSSCTTGLLSTHKLQWEATRTCTTAKILRVHMDENLTWADHALLTSCYAALTDLQKLRNLAPYHVRKHIVGSLVLLKLEYGCVVFYPLPDYQMKLLQRVQTTCASYVIGCYAVLEDLQKLNWLPIIERKDLAMLKTIHKALYDDTWPEYLHLKFHTVSAYNLRSLEAPKLAKLFQLKAVFCTIFDCNFVIII